MSKYAVFVDDGLDNVLDNKDDAKAYASEVRSQLRSEGHKWPCFIKRMTKDEMKMFAK